MKIIETSLEGLLVIEPRVFEDKRGYFMETYHGKRYREHGLHCDFVQDNLSWSARGTLRGLHFQIRHPQDKLVQVISGEIFDVVVDLRPGVATYGQWEGFLLSGTNHRQLFIPRGFAHGFCVVSDSAHFAYKCSDFYAPEDEGGIRWSDPDIGIEWPIDRPLVSEKDSGLPLLADLSPDQLPRPAKKKEEKGKKRGSNLDQ